jgi:hypothetical protein
VVFNYLRFYRLSGAFCEGRDCENVQHCVEAATPKAFTKLRVSCARYCDAYSEGVAARIVAHESNMRTNPTQVQTAPHHGRYPLDAIARPSSEDRCVFDACEQCSARQTNKLTN